MKTVFGALLLFVLTMGVASAEDYWFALDPDWPVPVDAVHYPTADAACRKAYADDTQLFVGLDSERILAYVPPTRDPENSIVMYDCVQNWQYQSFDGSGAWTTEHFYGVTPTTVVTA